MHNVRNEIPLHTPLTHVHAANIVQQQAHQLISIQKREKKKSSILIWCLFLYNVSHKSVFIHFSVWFVISLDQTCHDHFIYFRAVENTIEARAKRQQFLAWIMFSLFKSDKFSLIFVWQLSERNIKMATTAHEKDSERKKNRFADVEIGSFVRKKSAMKWN